MSQRSRLRVALDDLRWIVFYNALNFAMGALPLADPEAVNVSTDLTGMLKRHAERSGIPWP